MGIRKVNLLKIHLFGKLLGRFEISFLLKNGYKSIFFRPNICDNSFSGYGFRPYQYIASQKYR